MDDDARKRVAAALVGLNAEFKKVAGQHWLAPHRDAIVEAFDGGASAVRIAAALAVQLDRTVTRDVVYAFVRANGAQRAKPRKSVAKKKRPAIGEKRPLKAPAVPRSAPKVPVVAEQPEWTPEYPGQIRRWNRKTG